MDAFDQIPTRRSKQNTKPPAATPPEFTFQSPEDTPRGARFKRTINGFKVTAPTRSWLTAIVFGSIAVSVGYLIVHNWNGPKTTTSFIVCMSIVFAVATIMFSFYAFGKVGIEINGEKLYLKKTVFGLGFSGSLVLRKIIRAQVVKRSGTRGIGNMVGANGSKYTPLRGTGFLMINRVTDQALELETDTHIKTIGTNLRAEHLYYMRYLIIEAVKASRNTPNP